MCQVGYAEQCPRCGRTRGISTNNAYPPLRRVCTDRKCADRRQALVARQERQRQYPPAKVQARMNADVQDKAIEGLFWSSYLPPRGQSRHRPHVMHPSEADAPYYQLMEITLTSPLVKQCARAFAFASVGRACDERQLKMRGAQIYGTVLRQMSAMVANPEAGEIDNILACCVAMLNYEALRDDSEKGAWYFPIWLNHVKGLCQVLQTRESSFSGKPSTAIRYAWREARLRVARSAMFLRRPVCMLGRPPWAYRTEFHAYDDMLDACFAVVQWFPQIDELMQRQGESWHSSLGPAAVKTAVQRGLDIAKDLMKWEERALVRYCDDDGKTSSLYALCSTANSELLNLLTHYWMVCNLLFSQLRVFVGYYSLWYPELTLPFWIDPWPYAVWISHVGPLSSDPSLGVWSTQQAVTPMIATIFYFAGCGNWHTPESRSLRDFIEKDRLGNELIRRWFQGMFADFDMESAGGYVIPEKQMLAMAHKWYGLRDSLPPRQQSA